MIKIANRGNFAGRNIDRENTSVYIEEAICAGYDVKVDVWLLDKEWYLGHNFPKERIDISFLERQSIWTHARDLVGYVSLYNNPKVHVFWHNKDEFAITNKGIKWASDRYLTYDGITTLGEFQTIRRQEILAGKFNPLGICCDDVISFSAITK